MTFLHGNTIRHSRTAIAALAITIAGCGGGSDETPQKPAANVPAPQPIDLGPKPEPLSGIRSGLDPKQAEAQRKAEEERARQERIEATTDPGDFFAVANDVPNFLIVGDAPDADPDDAVMIAALPLSREGSSAFTIESGGRPYSTDTRGAVRLPEGFIGLPQFGVNENGQHLRILCEKDQSVMALVPEGTFQLGNAAGPAYARPENIIELDAYYIDIYEVTVGQYRKYMDAVRDNDLGPLPRPLNLADDVRQPIRGLNWGEARKYADWVGKDLPTEAEWEKAARGPHGFPHPWGHGRALWTRERDLGQIDPVGSFQHDVSYYGVYDMAGNVREWCLDHYTADAYEELVDAVPKLRRNWSGPRRSNPTNHRVVRGNGPDWTLWHRWPTETGSRPENVGFRSALRLNSAE